MNTTMAPLQPAQAPRGMLVNGREQHEQRDGRLGRRGGGSNENRNKRDRGDGSGVGGGGGHNGNNSNFNGIGNVNNGGGRKSNSDFPPEPTQSSSDSILSSIYSTPTVDVVSSAPISPTTVVVISTTTASMIIYTSPSISSSSDALPSLFPTTVGPVIPTITIYTSFPESTDQPRKGLGRGNDSVSATITSFNAQSTDMGLPSSTTDSVLSLSTPMAFPDTDSGNNNNQKNHNKNSNNGSDLSQTAEHLLIAAGAIGAFIIILAAFYLVARMRKVDLFASFRNHRLERGGSRGWYGWRRQQDEYYPEPPPQYSGGFSDEKSANGQQHAKLYAANVSPLARVKAVHQNSALLDYAAPLGASPVHQQVTPSQQNSMPHTFYNPDEQLNYLARQGTQTSQVSAANSGYRNVETQQSFQTTGGYDPKQREVNHLSTVSSLSSGFGDGLIIPEPTVVGVGETRQSYRNTRKFSWMQTSGRASAAMGDRDTVYTTASIETAPRFRTINSWVAQQSSRFVRQEASEIEVPTMPAIPPAHQRAPSEDSRFQQHPGDEINIGRGSRVPSSILDRKVNANLR